MTYEGPLPPGHSSAEDLDLDLPGIPDGSAISVVMPLAYGLPGRPTAVVMVCRCCGQPCWVSDRAVSVDMPRVCWDCIDEQVHGFVERKMAER